MTVNGVGNKTFLGKISGAYQNANVKQREKKYSHVTGNYERGTGNIGEEKKTGSQASSKGRVQVDCYSGKYTSMLAVTEAGRIHGEATAECEARHISYVQSDQVRLYAEAGYALKAQTVLDEHKVYIEQKNDDGTVKGYMVDPLKVPEGSTNPVELLAKECWEQAKDAFNDGTFSDAVAEGESKAEESEDEKTFREALLEFHEFVEERIKNGPPKIPTGGSEFSVDEWDKLMDEMDDIIDAFKRELRERIAKRKEKEELSADSENRELASLKDNGSSSMEGTGALSPGGLSASENKGELSVLEQEEDQPEKEKDAPVDKMSSRSGRTFRSLLSGEKGAPYSYLADETGIINYKGVIFQCDDKRQRICLGDVNDEKNVLKIPLSDGGSLWVNRDNLGQLADAIGMFSPEDVKRILSAIAQDNMVREMEMEIEDETSGLGTYSEEL